MRRGMEKSDALIVPEKRANKADVLSVALAKEERSAAERVEGSGAKERNAVLQSTARTQSRTAVSQAQARIREAIARNERERLTALLHHVTIDGLRAAFFTLKRNAAAGVDEVTWECARGRRSARRSSRARASRSVSGAAVTAEVHSEAGRQTTTARHRGSGGQDRPGRLGRDPDAGLRGGVSGLQLWLPSRAQPAQRAGCARVWNRKTEGAMDTRRRHPVVL
jgi:hypothetical protein